mmetsp:Transcript_52687/g.140509  ORF Transcript_52687/g.140509 Transcript_52687/m.140509 type:complete len:241 (+) Transcript_52687:998-1720(+)
MHEIQIIWRHCQQMYPASAEELEQTRQAPLFLAPFASFASFFGGDCLPMVGGLGLLGDEGASFLSSRADKAEPPRALPATTAAARATPCVISLSKASIPASKSAQFSSGTSSLISSSDSGVVNHSHFKASLAQGRVSRLGSSSTRMRACAGRDGRCRQTPAAFATRLKRPPKPETSQSGTSPLISFCRSKMPEPSRKGCSFAKRKTKQTPRAQMSAFWSYPGLLFGKRCISGDMKARVPT